MFKNMKIGVRMGGGFALVVILLVGTLAGYLGGWVDAIRHFVPMEEKVYTWWSYRAADWQAGDRGRRLDHIWVTPHLAPRLEGTEILRAARAWPRPSDHVPVIARFAPA